MDFSYDDKPQSKRKRTSAGSRMSEFSGSESRATAEMTSFEHAQSQPDWLVVGGEIGDLIRSMNWTATPLGPLHTWPQSLRTIVNLVLASRFPMCVLWGDDLVMLYNEGYKIIAAGKHPQALGRSSREMWPEVWEFNKPIFEKVMAHGEAVYLEDQVYPITRKGYFEQASFTIGYSPIYQESGGIGGTLVTLVETTQRIKTEDSLRITLHQTNQRLQALMEAVPVGICYSDDPTCRQISGNPAFLAEFELGPDDNLSASASDAAAPGRQVRYYRDGGMIKGSDLPLQRAVAENRTIAPMELEVHLPSGRHWIAEVSGAPVRDRGGNVIGGIAVTVDMTERKRAEAQREQLLRTVQEERDKLAALIDSIPDEVWFADSDRKFTLANPSALNEFSLHGSNGAVDILEFARKLEVYHPDGSVRPEEEAPPLRALNGETVRNHEEIIRTPATGELRYRQVNANPVRDCLGRIIGSVSVVRDITERKRADEALRESEKKYRILTENVPGVIQRFDRNLRILYVSPQVEEATGTPPETMIGKTNEELGMPLELCEVWNNLFHKVDISKAAQDIVFDFPGPKGVKTYLLKVIPEFAPDGSVGSFLGISTDITALKQSEEALRESERRLREAQHIARIGNWEWNLRTGETHWSPEIYAMHGLSPNMPTPTLEALLKCIHPDDRGRVSESISKAISEGTQAALDYRTVRPDGSIRVIHAVGSVTEFDAEGKPFMMAGTNQDITESRQAELEAQHNREEIAHLSRVAMLSELSGSLAHELNQPLAAILSNAQAAQRFLVEDNVDLNEVRDILKDIVTDDRRAGEVIRRLRLLLKKGEFQLLPLDVNEVVQDVLNLVHSELLNHGIVLHTDLADKLPFVKGDRVQLEQVLLNLVVNANEAMTNAEPTDRQIILRTAAAEGFVRVSVTDRGTGIAPDVMEQLFAPFFTTKATGLGLGLPVSHTIITTHGGHLTGKNNPDKGATFEVVLPVAGEDSI